MSFATGLLCRECGATYPSEARYSCDFCFGPLEVDYDLDAARGVLTRESIASGPNSIWRYGALLPDPGVEPVDLGAGWTPLRRSTRLAEVLGVRELLAEGRHSQPDRFLQGPRACRWRSPAPVASASRPRPARRPATCATSVAAHAAFIGWPSVTIIPADLEKSKIAMAAIFGGTVLGVEGNYDDVNRLCVELVAEHDDCLRHRDYLLLSSRLGMRKK